MKTQLIKVKYADIVGKEDLEGCAICLDNLRDADQYSDADERFFLTSGPNCGHYYHLDCMQ
jgi:hypothetical protein